MIIVVGESKPRIHILQNSYGDNKCFICNKEFKHTRCYLKDRNELLPHLILNVAHTKCKKLVKQVEHLKRELVETEFELFCLQDNCDNLI